MNNDDLVGSVDILLKEANGIGLALSDEMQDLFDLSLDGISKQNEGLVIYEVTRSIGAYKALLDCMRDKINDSRQLLEAGMKQGGDPDADNA